MARGELDDVLVRMDADALEDIDEIGVGVHRVEAAGREQTLDDTHALGADLGGCEEPIAFSHRNGAQRALEMVMPISA